MDIFKFNNPTDPTKMEQGEIINDLKSKMWVERYEVAGEFTLLANASTGMRDILPIGTFISHLDTKEIMIVEDHEITDDPGKEPEIKITGRGYESFLENRFVGSQGLVLGPEEISNGGDILHLGYGKLGEHIVELIQKFAVTGEALDPDDAVPYLEAVTFSGTDDAIYRNLDRGTVYIKMVELLKAGNLGLRVVRPGPWSILGSSSPNVAFEVHQGVDRSSEIIFSQDTGEIESADYLWSIRKRKNSAYLRGKWIQTIYLGPETGIDRRMMEINAESVDGSYTAVPTGGDLTTVLAGMEQLAIDTLAAQTDVSLTKADVSKDTHNAGYRTDFDVGDIIMVSGDYDAMSKMRINEYVEVEDHNGNNGYPALTAIS